MINKIHQRRRGVHCFLVPPPPTAPSLSLSLLVPKSSSPIPIRLSRFRLHRRRFLPPPPPLRISPPCSSLHANLEAHCLTILGRERGERTVIALHNFRVHRCSRPRRAGNPFVFERRGGRPARLPRSRLFSAAKRGVETC